MKNLGSRIREARVKLGLSQVECAKKLGVRNGQLSRWERGATVPRPVTLRKICEGLGIENLEERPSFGLSPAKEAQYRVREILRHGKKLAEVLETPDES